MVGMHVCMHIRRDVCTKDICIQNQYAPDMDVGTILYVCMCVFGCGHLSFVFVLFWNLPTTNNCIVHKYYVCRDDSDDFNACLSTLGTVSQRGGRGGPT